MKKKKKSNSEKEWKEVIRRRNAIFVDRYS